MLLVLSVRLGDRLLLLDLWLKGMHGILLLMLLLLRLLLLLLIMLGLRLVILGLVRLLLLVVLLRDLSILWLIVLLLLMLLLLRIHGSLVTVVLRVDGNRRAKDFNRAIVSSNGDHVLALGATVLSIFEPASQAGHAGQADTEEAENSANNTINMKPLAKAHSFTTVV